MTETKEMSKEDTEFTSPISGADQSPETMGDPTEEQPKQGSDLPPKWMIRAAAVIGDGLKAVGLNKDIDEE